MEGDTLGAGARERAVAEALDPTPQCSEDVRAMYGGIMDAGENAATFCYDDYEFDHLRWVERTVHEAANSVSSALSFDTGWEKGAHGVEGLSAEGRSSDSQDIRAMARATAGLLARLTEHLQRAHQMGR